MYKYFTGNFVGRYTFMPLLLLFSPTSEKYNIFHILSRQLEKIFVYLVHTYVFDK